MGGDFDAVALGQGVGGGDIACICISNLKKHADNLRVDNKLPEKDHSNHASYKFTNLY